MSVNTKVNGQLVPSAGLYKKSTPMSVATCYSEDEHKIGVWINNKPLYQKTIELGTMPNNTTKEVAHNISNLEKIVAFSGFYRNPTSGGIIPITFTHSSNLNEQLQLSANATNISVKTSTNKTSLTDCYVTLQYTKTTDNVTCGTYAPIVPMNIASKYSEEEKVVGQWYDGKPLYQKTIVTEKTNIVGNSSIDISSDISSLGIDKVIDYKERMTYSVSGSTGEYYSDDLARFRKDGSTYDILLTIGNATLSTLKIEWTIQYTKTADTAGTGLYADDEATLGMLGDVDLENLSDGDIIKYNGTSGKFENVPKEEYSTTEQVIGTFMGETLYEKTIDIGALPNTATSKTYAHGVTGNIVRYDVSAIDNNGTVIQLPFYSTASNYNIGVYVTNTNVVIETQRDSSGYTHCYVTLRYTKTSS